MNLRFFVFCLLVWVMALHVAGQDSVIAKKINVAVINLKAGSGVSEGECELITDRLRTELFNTRKVNVMERSQMQEILKEQGFQQSGACTDDACLVEMGQMLGVQSLVIGSLGKLGSMFMINVRKIDVRTAKVLKVVSVDVRGDIEEVVAHIARIAQQLVSSDEDESVVSEAVAPVVEEKKEPVPEITVIEEEPKEEIVEKKPEPEVVKKEAAPVVQINHDKLEKRRNRAGIGITFDLYGPVQHKMDDVSIDGVMVVVSDYLYNTSYSTYFDSDHYTVDKSALKHFTMRFYIKAGPFLNISLGPLFMLASEEYNGYENRLEIDYTIPGIHTGLSFVKRWAPLKVNAGVMLNLAMPITHYTLYDSFSYYEGDDSLDDRELGFMLVPGIRAGAEILAGRHVGFSFDLVMQWGQYDVDFIIEEFGILSSTTNIPQQIVLPKIGMGMAVNFYF